jgi:hypothetical protein
MEPDDKRSGHAVGTLIGRACTSPARQDAFIRLNERDQSV